MDRILAQVVVSSNWKSDFPTLDRGKKNLRMKIRICISLSGHFFHYTKRFEYGWLISLIGANYVTADNLFLTAKHFNLPTLEIK